MPNWRARKCSARAGLNVVNGSTRRCRYAGKPVIVATQMLESMMVAPAPTRAEASDVASAVYEGVDAVMLSGESAAGRYPIEAVSMMERIIRRTERDYPYQRIVDADRAVPETTSADAITAAARQVAETVSAQAIVTFTASGSTTLRASRERPPVPILALTPHERIARNLALTWGVHPIAVERFEAFDRDGRPGGQGRAGRRFRKGGRPSGRDRWTALGDAGYDERPAHCHDLVPPASAVRHDRTGFLDHRAGVRLRRASGFVWAKRGRAYDVELVTTLVTNIGAPCLVFHTLANLPLGTEGAGDDDGRRPWPWPRACAAIGAVILRLAGLSQRAFLPTLIFPNSGNMGMPLCYLAFGDAGLAMAIAVFTVYAATQFTFGISLASGTVSLRMLARAPLLYAVPLALAFLLTGTRPPAWINATASLLGGLTIPMMLITLGVSLAGLAVGSARRSLMLAALRLVMGFAFGVTVAAVLGLDGVARSVLIVQAAMPVAVFNYLFALRYKTAPAEVAGVVVLSTAISFVTLPALLWYVL